MPCPENHQLPTFEGSLGTSLSGVGLGVGSAGKAPRSHQGVQVSSTCNWRMLRGGCPGHRSGAL